MCWAQIASEVELGTGIPTVIQGYTVAVLLDALRIWWDDQIPKMVYHDDQYVLVYTCIFFDTEGMQQYVLT
jgi:hypothetical protein